MSAFDDNRRGPLVALFLIDLDWRALLDPDAAPGPWRKRGRESDQRGGKQKFLRCAPYCGSISKLAL